VRRGDFSNAWVDRKLEEQQCPIIRGPIDAVIQSAQPTSAPEVERAPIPEPSLPAGAASTTTATVPVGETLMAQAPLDVHA
jgi:hypothetical protein